MAQLWATGPVSVWAAYDTSTPFFIGHGERAPHVETRIFKREIRCDLTGDAPIDRMTTGEVGLVSVEFVRYNESAITLLQNSVLSTSGRGILDAGGIGTLDVTEQACPEFLYLVFPYAAKAAMAGMVVGYRFYNPSMDHDSMSPGAVDPLRKRFSWTCIPNLNLDTVTANGQGKITCYDHDLSALSGIID